MRLIFGDKRLPARFWAKVHVDDAGCWLWTASTNKRGYGYFWVAEEKSMRLAHRVTLSCCEALDPALEVDHGCRTQSCCNPEHLEQVTRLENMRRATEHRPLRTHCPRGHAIEGDNAYRQPASGNLDCIQCQREAVRRWRRRKRA